MKNFDHKRKLEGIHDVWHKIILPGDIFAKTSPNLNDLRIFGLTAAGDTIEAPYLLRLSEGKTTVKEVTFRTLNTSHNEKGFFFTFEIPDQKTVNQIRLDFRQKNFDWRARLEGSQNLNEWFTILDDYRIISIKNSQTDFQFTQLDFPPSTYRYLRLVVDSKEKPDLARAYVSEHVVLSTARRNYPFKNPHIQQNKQLKQTEITGELTWPGLVSRINVSVHSKFDYYRPVTIQYVSDSTKADTGWRYHYATLTSAILNSSGKNSFDFEGTKLQKLKIIIHNQDNSPLKVDSIRIEGPLPELIARFAEKGTYFLTYGNKTAAQPQYDLDRFTEKIPATITTLKLGREQSIEKEKQTTSSPLFENQYWLWAVMALIIGLLGWFTIRMMRTGGNDGQ